MLSLTNHFNEFINFEDWNFCKSNIKQEILIQTGGHIEKKINTIES